MITNHIPQIHTKFIELRDKQIISATEYEKNKNYQMAYIAYWAILEDFVKRLGPICMQIALKKELQEWLGYIQNKSLKKPKPITQRTFDIPKEKLNTIPSETLLLHVLIKDDVPNIFKVLNPGEKFRKRRNSIAHSAENISEKTYYEFKTAINNAIHEVDNWLISNDINSSLENS